MARQQSSRVTITRYRRRGRPRTRVPRYLPRLGKVNQVLRKLRMGIHKFHRSTTASAMVTIKTDALAGSSIVLNNFDFVTCQTGISAIPYYFAWTPVFTMQDLPNYTEFTHLFDAYRITGVAIKFLPVSDTVLSQTGDQTSLNAGIAGYVHSVTDYDDDDTFAPDGTGLAAMREYESFTSKLLTRKQKYFIKPKVAASLYQGAFTGYGQLRNIWVDSNTNAQYYGKKFLFEVYNNNAHQNYFNFKVEFKYYLELKDVR